MELLRRATAHLASVAPLLTELGELFAAGVTSWPWSGARCGTRSSAGCRRTSTSRPAPTPTRRWRSCAHGPRRTGTSGREFGTIGARRGEHTVEVTSYRADAYDGQTRKPVVAFGDNLGDDLVRRDFTVNAMAMRLPSMEFVDPYAGLADLAREAAAHARGARGVVRRRPVADDAGRPVRGPARLSTWRPRCARP